MMLDGYRVVAGSPTKMDTRPMTPKEMYDARKAARKKLAEDQQISWQARQAREQADMFDIADRFVTAMERIADAMEAKR